jgi:competence protein ComEC
VRALWLGLAILLAASGCKGVTSSAPGSQGQAVVGQAPGAKVSEAGTPKVVIDRDCSKLEDGGDEYVCIKNEDARAIEMGSWVLRNVMGRSYNFPTGFQLAPGATVKLHTGAGADSATDLYWNYRVKPAWEKGDKLTLHNNENTEVFISEQKR